MTDAHDKPVPATADRKERRDPRTVAMLVSGLLAIVLGAVAVLLPVPYVVEAPGPAINTIGESQGAPLIQIKGRESFPADGSLSLTTVYVYGGPGDAVSFFDVARAWLDPAKAVLPVELVYPPGTTGQEIQEQNAAAMTSSQDAAVAAALEHEDIDFGQELVVIDFAEESVSASILEPEDVLLEINGQPIEDLDFLRTALNESDGEPVTMTVERDGGKQQVEIAPSESEDGQFQLGVYLRTDFSFPFSVNIALNNVGGPSAGMMFALGIIDKLEAGDLTGGREFAGTGTISVDGLVGPIGGIQQKMVGARDAGAEFFLAPSENCEEVTGHVPEGLTVVKVSTLDQAHDAVKKLASDPDASVSSCTG
ncbi:PDZ domain-containing protein [Arthrobacter roseus]|uniref:YlbL family protein n=1 Tax=Arthrobacter roseus TaxID=136274 RepID=UPI0030845995|nr:PDZ domain-containing protein [Arthrobacter roseus]